MAIAYNFNRRGISISANMLRSLNHYYNKTIGILNSLLLFFFLFFSFNFLFYWNLINYNIFILKMEEKLK